MCVSANDAVHDFHCSLVHVVIRLPNNVGLLDSVLDERIIPLGGAALGLAGHQIGVAEFHATHAGGQEQGGKEQMRW